ncbi:MAG: hypothetical protein JW864_09530 [Spirochaetes bacterium]|nr:hypothetical protein [Spirochaetota bacterium]
MRFVIHDHITEYRHFDLMIETEDELLKTWRIVPSDLDLLSNGKEIMGVMIQGHDKNFLSYEGPLSAGKGSVRILDQGNTELLENVNNTVILTITGEMFKGTLCLSLIKKDIFNIKYLPDTVK